MARKKGGWYEESARHSAAAKGIKTVSRDKLPTSWGGLVTSLDGYPTVKIWGNPTALSVRWASTLWDASSGDVGFLVPRGLPEDVYTILEEDDEYVFLAVLLSSGYASDKHRYLVTRRDWEAAQKTW